MRPIYNTELYLGGGFKSFSCSALLGEIQKVLVVYRAFENTSVLEACLVLHNIEAFQPCLLEYVHAHAMKLNHGSTIQHLGAVHVLNS